jgi:hypothetical protein
MIGVMEYWDIALKTLLQHSITPSLRKGWNNILILMALRIQGVTFPYDFLASMPQRI